MESMTTPRGRGAILLLAVGVLYFLFGTSGGHSSLYDGPVDILNSTLGFEKIFVVNLPQRTDRHDAMILMGAITDLKLTFVDGVNGSVVQDRVLPPGEKKKNVKSAGKLGNWRAHINVLQRIVRENLTTALILEDDLDWDVRVKQAFQKFALASQKMTQPVRRGSSTTLADQHPYDPSTAADPRNLQHAVSLGSAPWHVPPRRTPYGDDWDLLWLGHTGGDMPSDWRSMRANSADHPPRSLLTVLLPGDDSVPAPRHLKRHPFADRVDRYAESFAPHTRVVHEARGFGGAQAYAVTQRGARRLLLKFGIETLTDMWDICMRDFCEGVYVDEDVKRRANGGEEDEEEEEEDGRDNLGVKREGAVRPICIATNPPLMAQYWGGWGGSDLQNIGGGFFHKTGSISIRHSVRLNMKRLLARKQQSTMIDDLVDQWPDDGDGPW